MNVTLQFVVLSLPASYQVTDALAAIEDESTADRSLRLAAKAELEQYKDDDWDGVSTIVALGDFEEWLPTVRVYTCLDGLSGQQSKIFGIHFPSTCGALCVVL